MLDIKNVLVPTDFGPCSTKALEYARSIAHAFGARLHVVHVVEPPAADFAPPGTVPPVAPDRAAERRLLEESATPDDRETLRAKLTCVEFTAPVDAIVDYARQRHIDLIVVGTHGRRGLSRALMGSVAEQVVRTAPCPVFTVHEDGRDFLAADALVRADNTSALATYRHTQ